MIHYMPLDTSRFLGSTPVNRSDPVDVPQPSLKVAILGLSFCSIVVGIIILVTHAVDKNTAENYRLNDESSNEYLIVGCVFLVTGVVGLIVLFIIFCCGDAIGKWMGCLSK